MPVVLGLAGLGRVLAADGPVTIVTPASLASTDNAFGAGTLSQPIHMQEVYGAQDFPMGTLWITSPTNGAAFVVGTDITVRQTVSGGQRPYTVVLYTNDGGNGPWSAAATNITSSTLLETSLGALPVAAYGLVSSLTDSNGAAATSPTNTFMVVEPLTITLLAPCNCDGATFSYQQSLLAVCLITGGRTPYRSVHFYTNGVDAGAPTAGGPFYYKDLGLFFMGDYTIQASVTDSSGWTSNTVVHTFTIMPNPIVVALTNPTNGVYPPNQTITVTAAASVGSPLSVARVEFFFDGVSLGVDSAAPYSTYLTIRNEGSHTLYAVATDNLGMSSTSAVVNVTATFSGAFDPRQIKTVFVISIENHDWTQGCPTCAPQQLLGNPAAPYLNSLATPGHSNAAQVSYATKYYNVAQGAHPSEVNYIWSEAGTDFGVHTDNDPSAAYGNLFSTPNHLCRQLTDAGIAWKDYQEDLEYCPAASVSAAGQRPSGTNFYNGSRIYNRAVKHDPMQFFTDTQNTNVYPLAQLWKDLTNQAAGRYNWITPNQYNEMHSGLPSFAYHGVQYFGDQAAIAEGDHFLSIAIPQIMASAAYQDHGVILIWTDETESTDDTATTIPFFVISPLAKGNAYASSVVLSHSSTLRMMDEIFGLAFQTNEIPAESIDAQGTGYNYVDGRSAAINDLSDLFQVTDQTARVVGGQMLPGAGGYQLTITGPASQIYQVLASSDLALPRTAWTVVSSGTFGTGSVIFTDPSATNRASRFYTVKSPF